MNFSSDYYSILGLEPTATEEQIKKSFKDLVRIYHPDRKSDVLEKELANKQMMVINGTSSIIQLCISITTNLTIYIFKRCMYFCPILSYPRCGMLRTHHWIQNLMTISTLDDLTDVFASIVLNVNSSGLPLLLETYSLR